MSKMEGMLSVSTSTTANEYDYKRRCDMNYDTMIADALTYMTEKLR